MPALHAGTRWFILYAADTVQELTNPEDEYGEYDHYHAPGLYGRLLYAGYPLTNDNGRCWEGVIDLATDGERVVVYTTGAKPRQHVMPGPVADLFLSWYRTAQPDHEEP